jgi:hypothetical protein
MHKSESSVKARKIISSIVITALLCWTVLPLFIPPFRTYSSRELIEVLLWQVMAIIGWPLALLGGFFSIVLQDRVPDWDVLVIFIYPVMLLILVRVLIARRARQWELILLHLLIAFSFLVVWYPVLNGYDFMKG